MKREYMEELRVLIDSIRTEGRSRRRAVIAARWALLSFLRRAPRLERAVVPVRESRWSPPGGRHGWN